MKTQIRLGMFEDGFGKKFEAVATIDTSKAGRIVARANKNKNRQATGSHGFILVESMPIALAKAKGD